MEPHGQTSRPRRAASVFVSHPVHGRVSASFKERYGYASWVGPLVGVWELAIVGRMWCSHGGAQRVAAMRMLSTLMGGAFYSLVVEGDLVGSLRTDRVHGDERLGPRLDCGRRREPDVIFYPGRSDSNRRLHVFAGQAELRGFQVAAVHGAPGVLAVGAVDLDDGRGGSGTRLCHLCFELYPAAPYRKLSSPRSSSSSSSEWSQSPRSDRDRGTQSEHRLSPESGVSA